MTIQKRKKILFTGIYFHYYSGSQMYITEMAKHLCSKNCDVCIVSPHIRDDIKSALADHHILLCQPQEIRFNTTYDIVFAFHYPIIEELIKRGLQYRQIVNFSLSPYEALEKPVCFHKFLNIICANSKETKDTLIKEQQLNPRKVRVIPNFLPDEFIRDKSNGEPTVTSIAVISNHIPQEIKDLPPLLEGIHIDFFGLEFKQVEVTPELLSKYSVVISIGKTVQYCLGLGVPIYEYDRFGGCGYVSPENFDIETALNFSGRASNRKLAAAAIAQELCEDYADALRNLRILQKKAISKFSYRNIDKLMARIQSLGPFSDNKKNRILKMIQAKEQ